MKNIVLVILPLILFSCANNSEKGPSPKSFQQITYGLDTLADKYAYKTLWNITEVILNDDGEITTAVQTNFSIKNQNGLVDSSKNIYSTELYWWFGAPEIDPIFKKYYEQTFTDSVLTDGDYTFQYDINSRLISHIFNYYGELEIRTDFIYDQYGQWTQITKQFHDFIGRTYSYEITERTIRYDSEPFKPVTQDYLTVNGVNLFTKEKKTIVDYYMLLKRNGIFQPQNDGGTFDVSNGYFEYEDEGTGAGIFTGQIVLFKTLEGKDILAINGYLAEYEAYARLSGDPPNFIYTRTSPLGN